MVESYVGIIAKHIIKPDYVVHDLAKLLPTYLTEPTVYSDALIYVSRP